MTWREWYCSWKWQMEMMLMSTASHSQVTGSCHLIFSTLKTLKPNSSYSLHKLWVWIPFIKILNKLDIMTWCHSTWLRSTRFRHGGLTFEFNYCVIRLWCMMTTLSIHGHVYWLALHRRKKHSDFPLIRNNLITALKLASHHHHTTLHCAFK